MHGALAMAGKYVVPDLIASRTRKIFLSFMPMRVQDQSQIAGPTCYIHVLGLGFFRLRIIKVDGGNIQRKLRFQTVVSSYKLNKLRRIYCKAMATTAS